MCCTAATHFLDKPASICDVSRMREKELRLALVCYGGISLAVYMHGITKEIWLAARASRDVHDGDASDTKGSRAVYRRILKDIATAAELRLTVMADIIAGASAGGINGIFLAHAIETGRSLEPLTDLWLDYADVDTLLDPDARPVTRMTKFWAQPLIWAANRRPGDTIERTVSPDTREEVRRKLSNFIRSRWFEPPFGGAGFSNLLLNAFDAMEAGEAGPALVPARHPLDLFVTVTDFDGHRETLMLNSPAMVTETEHRLIIGFRSRAEDGTSLGESPDLCFAARATASFPGAFPPFTVRELDGVLATRERAWPGRDAFLSRILPHQFAAGKIDDAVLIDGSVLANAPFAPAIAALRNRPARREVDRRLVYIDPKPRARAISFNRKGEQVAAEDGHAHLPGFFRTIFGALSDIPREQPIRDNLESIDRRSGRIRHMRRIVEALRPEIEDSVEESLGGTFFLDRPTPARLAAWRAKAQTTAARAAGFAYPAYGHLKLAGVVDDLAALIFRLGGDGSAPGLETLRASLWEEIHHEGLDRIVPEAKRGASEAAILFFRNHDLGFRIRRLRFLARRLAQALASTSDTDTDGEALLAMHEALYDCLARYSECEAGGFYGQAAREAARNAVADPANAMAQIAIERDLKQLDDAAEIRLSDALAALSKADRRTMLLAYLGFPWYDIATLPLLQGEGLDEYDPVKVDRIAPDDATSIRSGGAEATLKGIEFNSFGAFFSRSYRENDYLWGRLHGAERMIDIMLSTLPAAQRLSAQAVADYKRDAFHAILDEEQDRLTHVPDLIADIRREVG